MDYSQWSPAALFNLNPAGAGLRPAGEQLPPTSHRLGDRGALPWSPDSPQFWLIGVAVLTFMGIIGASVSLKAGPAKGSASLGKV